MALTSEDLKNINNIVETVVTKGNANLKADLEESMDRMESRLTTAIGLVQRDSFSRLDDHETRIRKLEQASSRP